MPSESGGQRKPRITEKPKAKPAGWQKQKSDQARQRILAATVECLAEAGYSALTISAIAERAGVSRGAMQHHFASKHDVIRATVSYIFDEELKLQRVYARQGREPIGYELHRRRVETLWDFLKAPPFSAFVEIAVASRNDPELRSIVRSAYRRYTRLSRADALETLPEWQQDLPKFEFVANFVATLLEGMAMRQMFGESGDAQDKQFRNYLAYLIEAIFHKGIPDIS